MPRGSTVKRIHGQGYLASEKIASNLTRGWCLIAQRMVSEACSKTSLGWKRSLKATTYLTLAIGVTALGLLGDGRRQPADPAPDNGELRFMSWAEANTAEWDQKLHISAIRMGCSAKPADCLRAAATLIQSHPGRRVFLSVTLKSGESESYAQEYSRLSQRYPFLEEVGVDDFVQYYARLFSVGAGNPVSTLAAMVDGLKSENNALRFGITLYENELDSQYLNEPKMSAALRNKVDYVHLFLIYRANAGNYESYVSRAKRIFPNAKVIGGVYAYDRISYVPCKPRDSRPCTPAEEFDLFKQSLEIQIRLLKSGQLDWLEFFPGAFGNEANWNAWDRPRICPDRKQECITNTQKMRGFIGDVFSEELGPALP